MIFSRRVRTLLWQAAFLAASTTWLWAPYLNPSLSARTTLISQYEAPGQAYAWLFRAGDILTSLLLLGAAYGLFRGRKPKAAAWLFGVVGLGFLLDPLLADPCRAVLHACSQHVSAAFVAHAAETALTAAAVFALSVYDTLRRRNSLSGIFVALQVGYGLVFALQLTGQLGFNTIAQYVYQLSVVIWIAWLYRGYAWSDNLVAFRVGKAALIKDIVAGWAFVSGVAALLASLTRLHTVSHHLRDLYFAGNTAWLDEHGAVTGVVMIYLSRHLARGELRARQIFLLVTGLEVLKYSVMTPDPWLLLVYSLTFIGLFVLRDVFDRGLAAPKLRVRVRDALFMLGALLFSSWLALLIISYDPGRSRAVAQSVDHFFDYTLGQKVPKHHLGGVLFAQTESVFVLAGLGAILWALFRPYKLTADGAADTGAIEDLLARRSSSTEDYFKVWPRDKQYYMLDNQKGFIAYKAVGPVVFALADPVAPPRQQAKLTGGFVARNRSSRLRTCFLPVLPDSLKLYEAAGLQSLQIGASALISTGKFMEQTSKDKWWRWKNNQAMKSGYEYCRAAPPHSGSLLQQLRAVSDAWLGIEGHTERGFALGYFDESYLQRCTIHYLQDATGKIVAFTNQLPAFRKQATVSVDLLRYLPDVNAMPYLLAKTIEDANRHGYRYFDLGFVPFAATSGPIQTIARLLSSDRFSAKGLEQFKNKFDPEWQPMYLVYDGDLADLALIALNLDRAMAVD